MDLLKMIAELRDEKQRLDDAIEALERLTSANSRRRGKPAVAHSDREEQDSATPSSRDDQAEKDREDTGEEMEARAEKGRTR
jgi:hypothetical protein